jgi:hypothetical protein
MARHEQAKRAVGTAVGTVEGVQVHPEPLITGTQRRNDIRITGSAAIGLSREDIDITIVSLASLDSQTATLPLATTGDGKNRQSRRETPQRRGKGETTPTPTFRPTIQALYPLPWLYDGNRCQGRSQALEIHHERGSLLSACQAALPRPAALLRAIHNLVE